MSDRHIFEKILKNEKKRHFTKKNIKTPLIILNTKSRTALLFMFNKQGHTSTVPTFKSCLCRHDICKTILFSGNFNS